MIPSDDRLTAAAESDRRARMKQKHEQPVRIAGDDPLTFFRVGFDDETVAMLIALAEDCHADPRSLICAIVQWFLRKGTDVDVFDVTEADAGPVTRH